MSSAEADPRSPWSASLKGVAPKLLHKIAASEFDPAPTAANGKATVTLTPQQRLWRRAKWSPDGTHLLAQTEAHQLDLFCLIDEACQQDQRPSTSNERQNNSLAHVFRTHAPSPLLDWKWYPFARHDDPASWCFAFSVRDVPIRLIDGYTGATRAIYGIEDHVERFVGCHALAFSTDGRTLYGGHVRSVSIFDITHPGTNTCATLPLVPTKATSSDDLQSGIVSTLAVAPHFATAVIADEGTEAEAAGPDGELVAVGTFAGTVGIYRRDAYRLPPGKWVRGKTPRHSSELCLAGWCEDEGSGITQLAFHPLASYLLLVASRGTTSIKCYDLRYLSTVPRFSAPGSSHALASVFAIHGNGDSSEVEKPSTPSAQRRWFDVDWSGQKLVAGDGAGRINAWSLLSQTGEQDAKEDGIDILTVDEPHKAPDSCLEVAQDSISSVAMHPWKPVLAVTAGARYWPDSDTSDKGSDSEDSASSSSDDQNASCSSDSNESTAESDSSNSTGPGRSVAVATWTTRDAHLAIWKLSHT
ncbi:unnamed protein product [Jaminaea pallidilutea]